jgi:hypothetical protein
MNDSNDPDNQSKDPSLYKPDAIVSPEKSSPDVPSPSEVSQTPSEVGKAVATPSTHAINQSKTPTATADSVTWSASEFVAHSKSFSWYAFIGLIALVIAAAIWLVTKDIFSGVLVFIGILLLGIYGAHKPRQLNYSLDDLGLTIGGRHYTFSEFRSFSVVSEGAFSGIELEPLKRFAMYVTFYFSPTDADRILKLLSEYLPMEEPRNDPIDQLMRRLRF